MNKKEKIVFLHIPKNGGTTFSSILKRRYTEQEIFQIRQVKGGSNVHLFNTFSKQEKEKINLVLGHFIFSEKVRTYFSPFHFKYVTMLRHPVERTVSFYKFVKRIKNHRLAEAVKGKSLMECVAEIRDFDVTNGQARRLTNIEDNELILTNAIANINQHFSYVGIQEYFDESILLFNEKFNWKYTCYNKLNAANKQTIISPDLAREIEKQNPIDLELYHIMKERFIKELEKIKFLSVKKNMYRLRNKVNSLSYKI